MLDILYETGININVCKHKHQLECGPMMVALSNIGGALCSTTKSLADTHY